MILQPIPVSRNPLIGFNHGATEFTEENLLSTTCPDAFVGNFTNYTNAAKNFLKMIFIREGRVIRE